jgi:hypothetical protein
MMRKAIWLGTGAAMLAAVPAGAAMPLNIQQRGTLHSIIDLPALDRLIPITRIEMIAPNVWRVTAGRCHIDVTMVERPGPYPGRGLGPPRMEPRAGRQVCER